MTTGKTIGLTRWTCVSKVMSLLYNMLSRLVIAFLPRSKCLLISWLQSLSAVILEPKKIKSVTVSIVSSSICHKIMGLDAIILIFWMLSFKQTLSFYPFYCLKWVNILNEEFFAGKYMFPPSLTKSDSTRGTDIRSEDEVHSFIDNLNLFF